jgi:tetratricopeptide (TPR) repeat protein
MHTYLWTAKDQWGNRVARRITAQTVQQARALLLESKCTDLQLQTDEMMQISAQYRAEMEKFSAEEQLKMLHQGQPTMISLLKQNFKLLRDALITAVVAVTLGVCFGDRFMIIVGIAGFLVGPATIFWVARPAFEYTKLNLAKAWCRWEEVLQRVERLQRFKRPRNATFPKSELARLRTQALVGLGRRDDALAEFEALHKSLGTPEWLYLAELSGLYEFARRYDDALATLRRAIEVGPENSNLWINYAFAMVHYKGDAAEARTALQRAEAIAVIELVLPKVALTYGLIARKEGDISAAKHKLEEALRGLLASPHRDLAEARIQITKAYLASVYSSLGDQARAQQYFADAKPFLEATGEAQLLNDCERGLESYRLAA